MKTTILIALTSLSVAVMPLLADTDYGDIHDGDVLFHSTDSLAARDDMGLLHSPPDVNSTDYAKRFHWRPLYWFEGKNDLVRQPAYVGAVQRDLTRMGYYCGPIDGVYSDDVRDAIARLQKNYSMRVTGTLTIPVRRALHLP